MAAGDAFLLQEMEKVPCIVVNLATKEEEDVGIVESNRVNGKGKSQLYNEAAKLREAYESLSKPDY